MKVTIYVRVSTEKQDLNSQLWPLLDFAKRRGYEVVKVYKDIATGKNRDRAAFQNLMLDAHQGKFEGIIVWALDRLTREGVMQTHTLYEQLGKMNVGIISYTEQWLDTTGELARNIMITVTASLAKLEREKISERTKMGLERVRMQGKKLGRPRMDQSVRDSAIRLVQRGMGVRETARRLEVSPAFVSIAARSGLQCP